MQDAYDLSLLSFNEVYYIFKKNNHSLPEWIQSYALLTKLLYVCECVYSRKEEKDISFTVLAIRLNSCWLHIPPLLLTSPLTALMIHYISVE